MRWNSEFDTRWNRVHTGTSIFTALWSTDMHLALEQRCVVHAGTENTLSALEQRCFVHAGTENTLSALEQRFTMRSGTEKHI